MSKYSRPLIIGRKEEEPIIERPNNKKIQNQQKRVIFMKDKKLDYKELDYKGKTNIIFWNRNRNNLGGLLYLPLVPSQGFEP